MYIRCIYGIFGRKITKYTVIYGVYIQIWPTLHIPNASSFFGSGTLTSAPSRISGARYQSVTTRGVIAEGNGWKYLHQQQMFFREDERSNMDRAPATSILSTTSMWVTSGLPSCCAVSCNMYHATCIMQQNPRGIAADTRPYVLMWHPQCSLVGRVERRINEPFVRKKSKITVGTKSGKWTCRPI